MDGEDGGDDDDGVGSGSGDGCIIGLGDSNDILSLDDYGGDSDRHTPANCIVCLGERCGVCYVDDNNNDGDGGDGDGDGDGNEHIPAKCIFGLGGGPPLNGEWSLW